MGATTQGALVIQIRGKRTEFELGVCRDCDQFGYVLSNTMGHGLSEHDREGRCHRCTLHPAPAKGPMETKKKEVAV